MTFLEKLSELIQSKSSIPGYTPSQSIGTLPDVVGETNKKREPITKPLTEPQKTSAPLVNKSSKASLSGNVAIQTPVNNPIRSVNKSVPRPVDTKHFTKVPTNILPEPFSKMGQARNTGIVDVDGNPFINDEDLGVLAKLGYSLALEEYKGLEKTSEVYDLYSYIEKVAGVPKAVARAVDKGEAFSGEFLKDMDYKLPEGYEVKGDLCCPVEKTASTDTPYSQPTVENPYPGIIGDAGIMAGEFMANRLANSNAQAALGKSKVPVNAASLLGKARMYGNIAKATPALGVVAQANGAYDRYKKQDYLGAAIDGVGALGSAAQIAPHPVAKGVGLGVNAASTVANAARDIHRYNNRPVEFRHDPAILNNPGQVSPSQNPVQLKEPLAKSGENIEKESAERPGLWDNIRAKKARGEKAAKPGDEAYPDKKQWDKLTKAAVADPSQTILVTGHSGAGKSTLAKALAEKLNLPLHRVDAQTSWDDLRAHFEKHPEHERKALVPGTPENKQYLKDVKKIVGKSLKEIDGPAILEGTQVTTLSPKQLAKYKAHILVGGDVEQSIAQRLQRMTDKAAKKGITFTPEELAKKKEESRFVADSWHPGMEKFKKIPGVINYNHTEHELEPLIEKLKGLLIKKAVAAWQRSEGKNPEGGLNAKGRASYKRETGGTLKAPVTEKDPKGERASRQHSFCSRMCGMKSKNTGSKAQGDPDSRINKSLRKWNCKCGEEHESLYEKVACLVKEAKAPHGLKSSNIKAVGYDKKEKELEVHFHSGGEYKYKDVPKSLFDRIRKAKSPGKFFHKHIKRDNPFEYEKLAEYKWHKSKDLHRDITNGRPYPFSYLTGEAKELIDAIKNRDMANFKEEIGDTSYAAQMLAAQLTGLNHPVYADLSKFYKREGVWKDMFKEKGSTYHPDHMKGGSNYAKPSKIIKAFASAGIKVDQKEAERLANHYTGGKMEKEAEEILNSAQQPAYRTNPQISAEINHVNSNPLAQPGRTGVVDFHPKNVQNPKLPPYTPTQIKPNMGPATYLESLPIIGHFIGPPARLLEGDPVGAALGAATDVAAVVPGGLGAAGMISLGSKVRDMGNYLNRKADLTKKMENTNRPVQG